MYNQFRCAGQRRDEKSDGKNAHTLLLSPKSITEGNSLANNASRKFFSRLHSNIWFVS